MTQFTTSNLKTENPNFIVFLTDITGTQTIGLSPTIVIFDTEVRVDTLGKPTVGMDGIEIVDGGWYEIKAKVGAKTLSNERNHAEWWLTKNDIEIPASRAGTPHRSVSDGSTSASLDALVELVPDDIIKVVGISDSATFVVTLPNTCSLIVKRV